jgi:deoxyxylulose-5-phosphate synthase
VTASVKLVGLPDRFLDHGSISALRQAVGLSAEGIANAARELLGSKPLARAE